jgi:glycosyltransferase involved in cell wall biosynthesis
MQRKLSIITVNRNNAGGLKKTIGSVINQTFRNFEFIIIDGASSDNSVDVIKEYADNIGYWKSETDNGTYHAMNKGIKASSGEYCYFLNSGDYLADNTVLERIFDHEIHGDIVSGDVRKLRPNNKFRTVHSHESVSLHKLCIHSLPHQATMIRRSLFEEIGYYSENYKIASDWEFFLKALIVHNKIYQHINLDFSYFKLGGISSREESIPLAREESYECLKKLFPGEADDLMEYRNFHNSNIGQVLRLLQQKKKLYSFIDNFCGLMISGKKAIAGK